jgi:hypothetical protein
MGTIKLVHEIRCNAETFWKIFFDKNFNETLYRNALGFPEFSVVEQKETDSEIHRKAAGQPKMNVPGPVAKLLGANFRYTEDGHFDKKTQTWKWKLHPSALADKLHTSGSVRIEPAGEGRVRRIAEMTMEAKVFGIGGLLESAAEKNMRDGWEKSAEFMNKWIAEGHAG